MNYTWDVPNGSRLWNNLLTRGLLDGRQVSGDTAVVSGDWSGANSPTTTDNVDFTGGDGGTRARISGDVTCGSNCDPTPDNPGSYLNPAAFSRLTGRGDIGNAPVTLFRLPPIVNTNLSAFKNFQIGGGRRIQFRWEDVQRVQPGQLVGHQHHRAVQPGGRAGEPELRQGHGRPQSANHAGGDSVHLLSENRVSSFTTEPTEKRSKHDCFSL